MRVLLVNQCFYPDVVSSGQHLTDLALALTKSGHKVTVIAGRRGYDNPDLRFAKKEVWKGISIIRIPSTGLGKHSRFARAVDFGTFTLCCLARMMSLARYDAVVAMTSPPLISFVAALFACLKRIRFYCWIMDLNPDEAIVAGWLRKDSLISKTLEAILKFSIRKARKVIVLDRFMKLRLLAKGVAPEKIVVIPPWSHDKSAVHDPEGAAAFRASLGLAGKFVVMYAGNHSVCHPLDTLLLAARQLDSRPDIHFLFIGGGSEFGGIRKFAEQNGLQNITCLPYQPLNGLAAVLSSADLHVAVMGDSFAGIVHPCKIYNILSIGSPFLYIGPEAGHIADISRRLRVGAYHATHGDAAAVMVEILRAKAGIRAGERRAIQKFGQSFSGQHLLPRMMQALECAPESQEETKVAGAAGIRMSA